MVGSQHIPREQWQSLHGINQPYTAPSTTPWKTGVRQFNHAGLITAAGASSRMGFPKALLRLPDGTPLAQYQSDFLKHGGCTEVFVVLGAEADRIAKELPACNTAVNTRWQEGRLTSIQTGLSALETYDGCFIMPVDAVGIQLDTLRAVRETAETGEHQVVRPTHESKPGHLVWISRLIAEQVKALNADGDTPLNEILAPHTKQIQVDDPAILRNINTPEEWDIARVVSLPTVPGTRARYGR